MIDKRIFRLIPERFLCPFCGEWHYWDGNVLESYDYYHRYVEECNDVIVEIWVDGDFIHVYADLPCDKFNAKIEIDADWRDMEYDGTDLVKISFRPEADGIIRKIECKNCKYCDCCHFSRSGINRNDVKDEYNFTLDFESSRKIR